MAWPFPSRHPRRIGVQRTLSPDVMVHHPRKLVVLVAQLVSRHSCVAHRLRVVVRFPAGPRVRVKTVKFCEDFCVDWDDVEMHWQEKMSKQSGDRSLCGFNFNWCPHRQGESSWIDSPRWGRDRDVVSLNTLRPAERQRPPVKKRQARREAEARNRCSGVAQRQLPAAAPAGT